MKVSPIDYENETYVRVYTRDTAQWIISGFEGQTVMLHIVRKLDRSGVLALGGMVPAHAVSAICGIPVDFAEKGLSRLIGLGLLVLSNDALTDPWFLVAQEARKSDKLRARESRERRRQKHVVEESQPVTPRHDGHDASHTRSICDEPSQYSSRSSRSDADVTNRHSTLSYADPIPDLSSATPPATHATTGPTCDQSDYVVPDRFQKLVLAGAERLRKRGYEVGPTIFDPPDAPADGEAAAE